MPYIQNSAGSLWTDVLKTSALVLAILRWQAVVLQESTLQETSVEGGESDHFNVSQILLLLSCIPSVGREVGNMGVWLSRKP